MPGADATADLAVVGGGLIGLATAAAAADRGLFVTVLAAERPGAASRAGAGLLVPHYGGEAGGGHVARFMAAARDLYPAYVQRIEDRTGARVPFSSSGAIRLARSAQECDTLHATAPDGSV